MTHSAKQSQEEELAARRGDVETSHQWIGEEGMDSVRSVIWLSMSECVIQGGVVSCQWVPDATRDTEWPGKARQPEGDALGMGTPLCKLSGKITRQVKRKSSGEPHHFAKEGGGGVWNSASSS